MFCNILMHFEWFPGNPTSNLGCLISKETVCNFIHVFLYAFLYINIYRIHKVTMILTTLFISSTVCINLVSVKSWHCHKCMKVQEHMSVLLQLWVCTYWANLVLLNAMWNGCIVLILNDSIQVKWFNPSWMNIGHKWQTSGNRFSVPVCCPQPSTN